MRIHINYSEAVYMFDTHVPKIDHWCMEDAEFGNAARETNLGRDLVLGIDPGFTGALALIRVPSLELVAVTDMPCLKPSVFSRKPRPDIDAAKLARWVAQYAHKIELVCIEKVSAAPEQGVVSMFRF